MLTIGIDVGLSGGIAVATWRDGGMVPGMLDLHAMPVIASGAGKRRVDDRALGDMLGALAIAGGVALVAYERVHAMPKQGSVSMFSFGRSLGVVEMALAILRLPNVAVEPNRWKRDMQAPRDKAAVRLTIDGREKRAELREKMSDAELEAKLRALAGPDAERWMRWVDSLQSTEEVKLPSDWSPRPR